MKPLLLLGIFLFLFSCDPDRQPPTLTRDDGNLTVVASMRETMFEGQTRGQIKLDTIADRAGLYGLGPAEFLQGELLILNGQSYQSKVTGKEEMLVEKTFAAKAPFFVYTHQTKWKEFTVPPNVRSLKQLIDYVEVMTTNQQGPFVFKLSGPVSRADIHVQNLPNGVFPSSPEEAHIGQQSYQLTDREVDIVGFFSTQHQGVFTHHDSYGHLHLITKERDMMGHLDALLLAGGMQLFLPNNY